MIAGADEAMKRVCLQTDIPFFGPPLLPGDVHIWWTSLDQSGSRLEKHEQILATDERARAKRFRFERDRNRFVRRRGVLREILGCYLGIEPNAVRLTYGEHGKPKLVEEMVSRNIEFSLSHSEGMALYGFSHDHQIGVDIEYIREVPEIDQIAGQFFSEGEREVLRSLKAREKTGAFYKCWTRKEALTKATGVGMSHPLDRLDVWVDPDEPRELSGAAGDSGKAGRWFVQDLNIGHGFAAAFALEGRRCRVHRYRCAQ